MKIFSLFVTTLFKSNSLPLFMRIRNRLLLTSLFSFVLSFTLLWNSQAVLGQIENEGQSNGIRRDRIQAEIDRGGDILLSDARKKYENKDYWKSAIDLVVILDFYTDYSKLDEAIYLLGNCLYEMGMFEAANRVYRYLLQTFPKTHLLPRAMLGMQKVYYQQNKYQLSLKFYKALEAHYPGQEGIDEARYYAGQAYYHLKNYHLVPNIVTHIRKDSEFYPFGMYTGALANLKKKV